jgi:hypothetical protein
MISGTVRPSAFARFDIDDEFELGRRLHRKLGGLLTLEDAIDIEGRLAELAVYIHSI